MNINPTVSITADVTKWSATQRADLEEKIRELDAIASSGAADSIPNLAEVQSTGWTLDAWHEAMKRLLKGYFVQAMAINDAIKSGTGEVSREQVYEGAGWKESERSLKGFTRPVNRIQADLVDRGVLPEEAEDLLAPAYPPGVRGYSRATGFRVPLEVVRLVLDAGEVKKSA